VPKVTPPKALPDLLTKITVLRKKASPMKSPVRSALRTGLSTSTGSGYWPYAMRLPEPGGAQV